MRQSNTARRGDQTAARASKSATAVRRPQVRQTPTSTPPTSRAVSALALLLAAARHLPVDGEPWRGSGTDGARVNRAAILEEVRMLLLDARELGVAADILDAFEAERVELGGTVPVSRVTLIHGPACACTACVKVA